MTIVADDFVLQRALDEAWLSPAQLKSAQAALADQDEAGDLTGKLAGKLVAEGVLTAWQVAELRAEELGLETVDLSAAIVADDVRALAPRTLAECHHLLPLTRDGRTLRVAVSNPLDVDVIDRLGHTLEVDIESCIAPEEDIARAIDRVYGRIAGPMDTAAEAITVATGDVVSTAVIASEDGDAPVIKRVQDIILEAIRRRASDVHLEPLEKRFRVRSRVDGVLLEVEGPPKRPQLAIISRLKIMANISIAEKRIPQDGRMQITLGARSLDLRVSSLPTAHGESVVLRLLDQGDLQRGLTELGFWADDRALFEQLIMLPDGLMLVTGPTGLGKTTTLYGCLHHLNKSDRKILMVEDPVEYQLSGINQVPVRHETGMTFGPALRAMLWQAPNMIMIGEIRDQETAEIALNASLTGHMVFSTLHTNDATGAIVRLADIGGKPFLLSASLRAVLAQRLVRKTCLHCRQPHVPTVAELGALKLGPAQAAAATFMRGVGCPECEGTGYRGRTGIFELFVLSEEIQQMSHKRAGSARLREKARALGMRTLREDGARKAIAGLTTIEEVVSITVGDAS